MPNMIAKNKKRPVSLSLSPKLIAALTKKAIQEDLSRSEYVEYKMRDLLKKEKCSKLQ